MIMFYVVYYSWVPVASEPFVCGIYIPFTYSSELFLFESQGKAWICYGFAAIVNSLQFENVNVKSSWLKLEKPSAKRVKWV